MWQAYYRIEPWGVWRDNLHAGIIASAVYAANANGPASINPTKFILDTTPTPESTMDETERAFLNLCISMGGKLVKPNVDNR
ncbi:MAG TPA: hypothetical protein VF175_09600 [Lacipirellula sp.]